MKCQQCRAELKNGYCANCGMVAGARICPNGHVMDARWTNCELCRIAGVPASSPRPAGFVKGATKFDIFPPVPATTPVPSDAPRRVSPPSQASPAPGGDKSSSRRLVGWLVTFTLSPEGSDYRLREGRNIVGSDPDSCDVIINDESISGEHAIIMSRDGSLQILDKESTNGTFVNGDDIFGRGAVPLSDGDRIRLGRTDCTLYAIRS